MFGVMVAMINGISTIYNDLSRGYPNGAFFSKGHLRISGKPRLLKFYILAGINGLFW